MFSHNDSFKQIPSLSFILFASELGFFLVENVMLELLILNNYLNMNVEMKEINGIPDYYISKYGDVYTTKYSKKCNPNCDMNILKPRIHPSGYLYVGLFLDTDTGKKRVWKRVHRLVAEHFIGEIPDKMVINHKDFNKHNNEVTNLEIVTSSQNRLHYLRNKNK